jgi:GR25 family glycosyltransferase involved in LPS biosynthesis
VGLVKRRRLRAEYEAGWASLADAIYCICLQERPNRFAEACTQLHRWGLCRLVRFYRPIRKTDAECAAQNITIKGLYGSWKSHQACAADAVQRQSQAALILEDDFEMLKARMSVHRVRRIARDRRNHVPNDWDVLFLGQMPTYGLPVFRAGLMPPRIWQTRSVWIHAYVLSPKAQLRIAQTSFVEGGRTPLDVWMRSRLKQYAVFPQICVQSCTTSRDNEGPDIIAIWQRVHRQYSLTIDIVVYIMLPILALLLAVAILYFVARAALK